MLLVEAIGLKYVSTLSIEHTINSYIALILHCLFVSL